MKKFFALMIVVILLLVSCGKADVIIRTDLENTRSSALSMTTSDTSMTAATNEEGKMIFIVNSSSKTFHISEECRHVKNMSDKNKIIVVSGGIGEMVLSGYSPCATCLGNFDKD